MRVPVTDELLDHDLRRERQERREQEHEQVQPAQARVGRAQRPRDARVLEPDNADRDEARGIREVRRLLVDDRPEQVLIAVGGQAQLEDRDRDREHRVAEPVESVQGKLIASLGPRHGRQYAEEPAVRDGREQASGPQKRPWFQGLSSSGGGI
jgi:hypothetical protein